MSRKTWQTDQPFPAMEEMRHALACRTPRERQIVILRYGLEDGLVRTLALISRVFRLSREWIRQIEQKALQKLQVILKHEALSAKNPNSCYSERRSDVSCSKKSGAQPDFLLLIPLLYERFMLCNRIEAYRSAFARMPNKEHRRNRLPHSIFQGVISVGTIYMALICKG